MDQLEDLHTNLTSMYYNLKAEGESKSPVGMAWDPVGALLTVPGRYFHCGTFCCLLCGVSLSSLFLF